MVEIELDEKLDVSSTLQLQETSVGNPRMIILMLEYADFKGNTPVRMVRIWLYQENYSISCWLVC